MEQMVRCSKKLVNIQNNASDNKDNVKPVECEVRRTSQGLKIITRLYNTLRNIYALL